MAIRLADYFKRHLQMYGWALAFSQVSLGIFWWIVCVFLVGIRPLPALLLTLVLGSSQFILIYFIGKMALRPLDILTRAITFISSQANDVKPPILTEQRDEETGLKYMVETIYTHSSAQKGDAPVVTAGAVGEVGKANLLDVLPCGVIALDADRKIIYANNAAPLRVDTRGRQSIALRFDTENSMEQWMQTVEMADIGASKTWLRIDNASPDVEKRKIFDVFATYAKNGNAGIETVILTFDRTEHYALDEEDMDFISLAAHELRGPITVIRGYLEVLDQELGPVVRPDQKALFERLTVSASKLSSYINNILNVSKFDRQHLQLHLQEDTLAGVYATVAADLQLRATTQNRILNVNIPADLPTIAADRNSLCEVVSNIIDNAIKYSHEGGQVLVSAAVDGSYIKCTVQDFGIGMPAAVVPRLFSKFYRSHRSRQTVSGTGLGLYISRVIVESHGGQIGVSSTEGKGSTFTFLIPIYATVAEKLAKTGNSNEGIMESSNGWIKNHAMIKG